MSLRDIMYWLEELKCTNKIIDFEYVECVAQTNDDNIDYIFKIKDVDYDPKLDKIVFEVE